MAPRSNKDEVPKRKNNYTVKLTGNHLVQCGKKYIFYTAKCTIFHQIIKYHYRCYKFTVKNIILYLYPSYHRQPAAIYPIFSVYLTVIETF